MGGIFVIRGRWQFRKYKNPNLSHIKTKFGPKFISFLSLFLGSRPSHPLSHFFLLFSHLLHPLFFSLKLLSLYKTRIIETLTFINAAAAVVVAVIFVAHLEAVGDPRAAAVRFIGCRRRCRLEPRASPPLSSFPRRAPWSSGAEPPSSGAEPSSSGAEPPSLTAAEPPPPWLPEKQNM
ncbi:hypothetical protein LINPERPRIM_LOCUS29830 [Linum perenne]